jgi:hypothetical protein
MGKNKKLAPRDPGFGQHLTDHHVHPIHKSQQPDLEGIRSTRAVPRPSLSLSRFSEGAFKHFQENNVKARDEADVLANVIPAILGPSQATDNCARNTAFSTLEPLTDGTITAAKPNIYWGAYPEELAPAVRNELAGHIVPSTMPEKPIAPNVFLEVNGPDGTAGVATRQVRYDGAIGARAMHSVQNYRMEEPQFDGKPHTFSFKYHNGTLTKYSHHMTAPTASSGGRPEYHMSEVDGWAMTSKRGTFVEAATDLRNTLDLAGAYRADFMRDANARASQAETVLAGGHTSKAKSGTGSTREAGPSNSMIASASASAPAGAAEYCGRCKYCGAPGREPQLGKGISDSCAGCGT